VNRGRSVICAIGEKIILIHGRELDDTLFTISWIYFVIHPRGGLFGALPWAMGSGENGALALSKPMAAGRPAREACVDGGQDKLSLSDRPVGVRADGTWMATRRGNGGADVSRYDGNAARSRAMTLGCGIGELGTHVTNESRDGVADRVPR